MDKSRELAATIVGAVIGGVAGYLFFTERGRSVRRQIEPALEDFSREIISFRNAIQTAAGVANDGWKLLHDTLGEGGNPPARYPSGQTSPFGGRTYVR
jgi:gas vesicle protein